MILSSNFTEIFEIMKPQKYLNKIALKHTSDTEIYLNIPEDDILQKTKIEI